jgi:hypothetical protein
VLKKENEQNAITRGGNTQGILSDFLAVFVRVRVNMGLPDNTGHFMDLF